MGFPERQRPAQPSVAPASRGLCRGRARFERYRDSRELHYERCKGSGVVLWWHPLSGHRACGES
jgi:hypothetical protein